MTHSSHLEDLLHFSRPLADVTHNLSAFAWDSVEELVTLERRPPKFAIMELLK